LRLVTGLVNHGFLAIIFLATGSILIDDRKRRDD